MFRPLTYATLIAAALYGGYWALGAAALKKGLASAEAQFEAQGGQIGSWRLAGFPSRFDVTLTDVQAGDETLGWRGAQLEVDALSYRPNHLIATLPDTSTLLLNGETLTLTASKPQANVNFGFGTDLPLEKLALVAPEARVSAPFGEVQAPKLALAAERQGESATYRLGANANGLALTGALRSLLDPAGTLPPALDILTLDALLTLDAPLTRESQPQPLTLGLTSLALLWGDLDLRASGALDLAGETPEGTVTLGLKGWDRLLAIATAQGALPQAQAATVSALLGGMAQQSADKGRAELPLIFRSGQMFLGPLPLGPAPRLR